jgi:hypothetical protein
VGIFVVSEIIIHKAPSGAAYLNPSFSEYAAPYGAAEILLSRFYKYIAPTALIRLKPEIFHTRRILPKNAAPALLKLYPLEISFEI